MKFMVVLSPRLVLMLSIDMLDPFLSPTALLFMMVTPWVLGLYSSLSSSRIFMPVGGTGFGISGFMRDMFMN